MTGQVPGGRCGVGLLWCIFSKWDLNAERVGGARQVGFPAAGPDRTLGSSPPRPGVVRCRFVNWSPQAALGEHTCCINSVATVSSLAWWESRPR